MTNSLSIAMLVLIGFCILTELGREVCFKFAAERSSNALRSLLLPVTWIGVVFWAVELFCWMLVLESVPLSIAFPVMALSYAAMALAGAFFFSEKINLRHAFGVLLITAGVICVGMTGI